MEWLLVCCVKISRQEPRGIITLGFSIIKKLYGFISVLRGRRTIANKNPGESRGFSENLI